MQRMQQRHPKCNSTAHLGQIEATQVVQRKRHPGIVQAVRPRQHLQRLEQMAVQSVGVAEH